MFTVDVHRIQLYRQLYHGSKWPLRLSCAEAVTVCNTNHQQLRTNGSLQRRLVTALQNQCMWLHLHQRLYQHVSVLAAQWCILPAIGACEEWVLGSLDVLVTGRGAPQLWGIDHNEVSYGVVIGPGLS